MPCNFSALQRVHISNLFHRHSSLNRYCSEKCDGRTFNFNTANIKTRHWTLTGAVPRISHLSVCFPVIHVNVVIRSPRKSTWTFLKKFHNQNSTRVSGVPPVGHVPRPHVSHASPALTMLGDRYKWRETETKIPALNFSWNFHHNTSLFEILKN